MHFIYTFYTLYPCTYILYIYTLDVYVDLICEPRLNLLSPVCVQNTFGFKCGHSSEPLPN